MVNDEIINVIKKYVKSVCENDSTGHDWWHIQRVYNNAMQINKKENAKNVNIEYFDNLGKVDFNTKNKVILINCAGKEGGDDKEIKNVLNKLKKMNNIFVDLRPQLNIEIVNVANDYGWDAYTGYGMNSRNDYILSQKIQEQTGISIPSFKEFSELVADAS